MSKEKPKKAKKEPNIIGKAYEELKHIVTQYAKNNYNVLFVGESGSGKELFAEFFMANSEREGKKLSQNCAGVPDNLLESEVFGHIKGAFTGAISERKGKLKTCDKGILFLDEIGDASEKFQAAINRVVEQNSYSKLGGDTEIKDTNTLIIGATNKPQGLRDDLKNRFHILYVPPLQKMDIPSLAEKFLGKPLKKEYIEKLIDREYPGNVRELNRECEKLKALKGEKIFSKKSQNYFNSAWYFDYERYVRENEIWNNYLQPLIDRHGPRYLKYKYMEWNPGWIDPDSKDMDENIITSAWGLFYYSEENASKYFPISKAYEHSILELVEWLRIEANEDQELPRLDHRKAITAFQLSKKLKAYLDFDDDDGINREDLERLLGQPRISSNNLVSNFRRHMRECFDKRLLPLLLELIEDYNATAELQTTITKPTCARLLDLPFEEAEKEFKRIFVEYNLKKYSNNKRKTAEALGVSISKINRAIKTA
jgi:DNA-binding NtrC family response regulator